MRIIFVMILSMLLVGCSHTQPVNIQTKPIERQALDLPLPAAVKLDRFKWIVITEENAEEVLVQLKKHKGEVALFALTADGYQAISLNNKKMAIYIQQLQDQLDAYKEYYESGKRR